MNAVVVTKQGHPVAPNIEFRTDWPELAPPQPGWATIRTLATAFNHMDLWVGMGIPGVDLTYPRISGCDACGVIESVGAGVDAAWVGKRIIVNAALDLPQPRKPSDPPGTTLAPVYELIGEHRHGMFAERFAAPVENLAVVADHISATDAAAFGLCTLTAYSMMCTKGRLRPGQPVLITGIGGGVASAALAIAKHNACPVAVTSRHQWKLDRAVALGADFAVLDKGQDWSREVRQWSLRRGVDMAVDSIGKATHLHCIKSLARGGAYVTPGNTSGADATTDLARTFWNQLRILGSTMGSNGEFAEIVALLNAGKLRLPVDRVYPAAEGRAAYERLEAADQFGKIVVTWT